MKGAYLPQFWSGQLPDDAVVINKLVIIGVGLIGGSLARALRQAGSVREIVGYGRSLGSLQEAMRLGVIDHAEVTIGNAARGADMIVLAVPVGSMPDIFAQLAEALDTRSVITDVGSVKGSVVSSARALLGDGFKRFVPGHPIAGTENTGVGFSTAGLFQGRRVILTPTPETDASAVANVRAIWHAAGAHVATMSPDRHDQILAASSHLPHVLAYALVDMLVRMDDHRAVFEFAGGGFRDFTRIAASDPVMWRDICFANRDALVALLRQYGNDLEALSVAIERGDEQFLLETFTRAKHARDVLNKEDI